MGSTKYDYSALLSDNNIVYADNEEALKLKIAGRTVIVSYHRKENDLYDDRNEIIIDIDNRIGSENLSKLPTDVCKQLK